MKNHWKTIKFGLLLFALPMVATAAASAHNLMLESNPISLNTTPVVAKSTAISSARVHTVALNRNGAIEGRIAAINADSNTEGLSSLKVFFVQDGKVVKETVTHEDGTFVVNEVPVGAYSFVAAGENGFAAYGVHVVSDETGKISNTMEAAAVSPHFAAVKKILNEKLPAEVTKQILAASTKADQNVVGASRVKLVDGQLTGRVNSLLGDASSVTGTQVHLIQNDKQVAEVQVDENGSFMVEDLNPGVYDFVASGPSGFAAVSFEAVQKPQKTAVVQDDDDDGALYVDSYDTFDVSLTGPQDVGFATDQIYYSPAQEIIYSSPIEYAGESIGFGGAGAVGGGSFPAGVTSGGRLGAGAFGGGGGGRLGKLLLLGGLATGIVALADNGGSDPGPATPTDP